MLPHPKGKLAVAPISSTLPGKYVLELRKPLKGEVQRLLRAGEMQPYQVVHLLAEEA